MNIKRIAVIMVVVVTLMAGCQEGEESQVTAQNRIPITIMTTAHTQAPMEQDSPVLQAIEDYTDTQLDIQWIPNSAYDDKMDITLASGDLPTIILVDPKSASVINAVRNGMLWDLTPYLDDYANLSQCDQEILSNISIDGNVYGIYRARKLGRFGISYRQDWMENLGLPEPKTIEDFYQMLKAFTYDDPDGNGMDDTYGMTITKYDGPWEVIQTWFGVPNDWGFDASNQLIPEFMAPEYMEALTFFRKLYEEGLVNKDFMYRESSKWDEPYLNGKCGVIVDVVEFGTTFQSKFESQQNEKKEWWNIINAVEGPYGLRNLPYEGGYSDMFAISKEEVQTEEELKKVLGYLDKMNDYEMQITMMYGLEGIHYTFDGDGYYDVYDDPRLLADYNDAAQLGMGIPEDFRDDPTMPIRRSPLMKIRDQVTQSNEGILIRNPCESFVSETYAAKGDQLDGIIREARIKYIVGKIDEDGFAKAIAQWQQEGGNAIMQEYNEDYIKQKSGKQ